MFVIYPSKSAYRRVPNHPWTFPVMIIMLALLFLLTSFSGPGKDKQDAEIMSLQKQITRIIMPFAKPSDKCEVRYAILSFILDSTSTTLDTINFESNLPQKDQDKIRAKLERGLKIDWKALGGEHSLTNKVIKLPILVNEQSKKCEVNGSISANQVARMLYSMLGTAEMSPSLIARNIYLPLTEIVVVKYPADDEWSIQNYNLLK